MGSDSNYSRQERVEEFWHTTRPCQWLTPPCETLCQTQRIWKSASKIRLPKAAENVSAHQTPRNIGHTESWMVKQSIVHGQ